MESFFILECFEYENDVEILLAKSVAEERRAFFLFWVKGHPSTLRFH